MGWMRRAIALVAVAALMPLAPGGAGAADGWFGRGTMLGGTARYDAGEWIYQDFVYDDYGADTTPAGSSQRVTLAATAGDFRYPADARYAANAADIAEVRVRASGDDLDVRVTLGTLIDASTTVLGFAIDTGSGTVADWPDAAGVRSRWDVHATVNSGGALIRHAFSDALLTVPVATDTAANTFGFSLPGLAGGDELSMVAGAGLAGPPFTWMLGTPGGIPGTFNSGGPSTVRVFDLAFNARALEPRGGAWQENGQAAALRLGDVTAFAQTIDLARLRSGETDALPAEPGFYNRVFRSIQNLGEGTAGTFPQYRSTLTPYALWLPADFDPAEPTPLIFNLHSLSVHHNQYRGGEGATSYFTMYEQLGDGLGAIVVTPLGGGPDGWYRNESLIDALEVLTDVQRNYDIDPDRIYITGYSMGGYGTYRIGTLFADRFAGAVSWAGVPTDIERLENLHSVPLMIVHGTNDELVPITGVRAQAARMRALGYEYRFHEHPGMDHFAFVWTDEWSRERTWLDGRTRVHAPARVHFKVQPSMWTTGFAPDRRDVIVANLATLGFDPTSAYWVREVASRDPAVMAEVDATSEAMAARDVMTDAFSTVAAGPPTPHLTEGLNRALGELPTGNALSLRVRGASGLAIDMARAGLDASAPLIVTTDADAATELRLDGGFGDGTTVTAGGATLASSVVGGVLTVTVPAGTAQLHIVSG